MCVVVFFRRGKDITFSISSAWTPPQQFFGATISGEILPAPLLATLREGGLWRVWCKDINLSGIGVCVEVGRYVWLWLSDE